MEKSRETRSNLAKKTCLSARVHKLEISLESNIGKIPKFNQDDSIDIEEMLSILSPRELKKPHHNNFLKKIDGRFKFGRELFKGLSISPDSHSAGKKFILRKIRLPDQKSMK